MKAPKSIYVCTECDYQSTKWMGKCPSCGAWNTFEEQEISDLDSADKGPGRAAARHALFSTAVDTGADAVVIDDLEMPSYMRTETGLGELDRVLGGGLVLGSVVLLSGEPGIGKSTMLMQVSATLGKSCRVLYVSGEESQGQLKLRAKRLDIHGANLYLCIETNIRNIIKQTDKLKPNVLIVDSIQTIYNDEINSAPGSVTQVKEAAMALIHKAKNEGISVLLVGHVNKEGGIAGPKVLEHMVDAVIYFEGERQQTYRIIRAIKNRYGSTNEIGVFEMTDTGLSEVENPSEMLLSGRPQGISGNCAVCVIEGSRPIVAEIQALVTQTFFPSPRRSSTGIDYNRLQMILAVLEKRLGLRFSANDAYLNVIGGLRLDEPAADLAVALSLISSLKDKVLPDDMVAIGELGLAGEVRAVGGIEQRVRECARLGFSRIVIPKKNAEMKPMHIAGVELFAAGSIYDTISFFA
ncbi:MAG: DNA repair protein RadA [Clostridia bacterium]|nr:DNA repair protein RadA [Clostridia bacterium]